MQGSADEEVADGDQALQAYGLSRLLALSDGVFAFALTLLVVQLVIPSVPRGRSAELGARLLDQAPSYASYLLSFAVISMYWYQHHRIFRYVRRWDAWLIILNLGALLLIAVMPFPTAIVGRYGDQTLAVVIYACFLGTAGVMMSLIWWHVINHHLASPSLDRPLARQLLLRSAATPAVFFLSIPLAFVSPPLAQSSWALIWVAVYLLSRQGRASRTRAG